MGPRSTRRIAALALTALLLAASGPSVAPDAPFVARERGGWSARSWSADGTPEAARPARSIDIAPVGDVPGFRVRLRGFPAAPAPSELPLDAGAPVFVMADSHGEHEIMASLLRRQGVVGADMRWRFGKGRLVVLGDMLDRGAHQEEILWLLYKLEGEARAAGGAVHVLLGNHEAMNLRGDLRYLDPKYPAAASALGLASYAEMLGADTLLGAWLRTKPTMLRLGDLLLLHGGVSPQLVASGLSIGEINAIGRAALDVPVAEKARLDANAQLVAGSDGPLWYRGYFALDDAPAKATQEEVAASLARFGARRILVGHTVVERVQALFGGRVIAVQVYPHRDEESGAPVMEGALRLDGRWWRAGADGSRTPIEGITP